MPDSKDAVAREARALLRRRDHGILGTISKEVDGFPFGSVTPYCLDRDGAPLILISTIAQHSKNIDADERTSITVVEPGGSNVQAQGRVCVLARAVLIDESESAGEAVRARYLRHFPSARSYFQTHGFRFFRLEPVRAYFIGGFGRIHWIEPGAMFRESPFSIDDEGFILDHMNSDHQNALRKYATGAGATIPDDVDTLEMCSIDAEGLALRVGGRRVRIDFDREIATVDEARAILVEMARAE